MRVAAIAAGLLMLVGALAAVPALGKHGRAKGSFELSGSIGSLRPGAKRFMTVYVKNPNKRALRVLTVSVDVSGGARWCTGRNLHIRSFYGRLAVPPRRTRSVRLRVEMARTAAPECEGATWRLRFRARGALL